MKVQCPGCKKSATLPDDEAGLVAVCMACGKTYRVPDAPPATSAATDPTLKPLVASAADPELQPARSTVALFWGIVGLASSVAVFLIVWGVIQWGGPRSGQVIAAHDAKQAAPSHASSDLKSATTNAGAPEPRSHPIVAAPLVPDSTSTARATTRPAEQPAVASATLVPEEPGSDAMPSIPIPAPPQPPVRQDELPAIVVSPRPPIHPVVLESHELTDAQIGQAIRKGAEFLLSHFDQRTHLLAFNPGDSGFAVRLINGRRVLTPVPAPQMAGEDILDVYALLQCGQAIDDQRLNWRESPMKDLVAAMKAIPLNDYHYETYARGLRATALALLNRPEDRAVLKMDAMALVHGAHEGAYTYVDTPPAGHRGFEYDRGWDNSNSQYGLLGVWSAAEVGFEVPSIYWAAVQKHWQLNQCVNGQWAYTRPGQTGTHSMTCAGLASLMVTYDYLEAPRFGTSVGREPFTPALRRGLAWLEQGDNCLELNRQGYNLYGLERVGLASGFKFFGSHDWYRELAARAIEEQMPDGSWGGDVETAYNLLFLARGRHPILMNKLRFDGYWANRPHDAANLARFAAHQLERPLNWQVVPLKRPWTDWMDSPILYLASHQAVPLTDADVARIRAFVDNGGLLFTQADGDSLAFNTFAVRLAHRLFPEYEMTDLPANHPLCSVMFKIKPDPPLKYVTNGSRILMLHSNTDLAKYWQLRDDKHVPMPFQLGTDLFVYAAGKRDLRNRLESPYVPPVNAAPTVTFKVARLSYNGNWNPEPAAWTRFGRWFQLQSGYGIDVVDCPMRELTPRTAPLADLTGTAAYSPTAAEVAAVKRYVESGGVLLVDVCGGNGAFGASLQSDLFTKAFPDAHLQVLSPDDPLLNSGRDGMQDLTQPRLRQFATDVLGTRGYFPESLTAGKGRVIFCSVDLTTALLGTRTWGILGFEPDYAQSLLKNVVLWTWDRNKSNAP